MPQTIDVTGLSPEAVRVVETLVGMLREKGNSVGGTPPPTGGVPPSQLPYEEWSKWFRAWVGSHPKRDIVIDDDRESIYDRSTE
jgi:hypothetical protein